VWRGWNEVGAATAATALGLFFVATSTSEDGASTRAEVIGGTVAIVALVLLRRRWPVALTLCLIPAGIVLAMPMGATAVALFAVGLHRRARVTVAVAVLHLAAVAVVYRLAVGSSRTYWEAVIFLILLDVILIGVAMLVRSHRRLVRSWAERARQAEEGQRMRVEQARLAERQQIAREMHDVLAHRISLVAVHAGALEVRREAQPDQRAAAGVIRQSAYDALEDLRQVIGMLRETPAPEDDRPQPTLADLSALGAEVEVTGQPPAVVGRHAYRVVQEALTNARKHAPDAAVRVAVRGCEADGLVVEVGNALRPGSGMPGAGTGLAGLRERVELAGGRLEHGPTPAGTFELRAWLPWQR
jgi:signal transduction histidine kinase